MLLHIATYFCASSDRVLLSEGFILLKLQDLTSWAFGTLWKTRLVQIGTTSSMRTRAECLDGCSCRAGIDTAFFVHESPSTKKQVSNGLNGTCRIASALEKQKRAFRVYFAGDKVVRYDDNH